MFLFSSTLTEALILHIADRSDVEMAKCDDSRVRWKSILQRKSICICEERKNTPGLMFVQSLAFSFLLTSLLIGLKHFFLVLKM